MAHERKFQMDPAGMPVAIRPVAKSEAIMATTLKDLKVKLFTDGADKAQIVDLSLIHI